MKELLENINEKNKKISELENSNSRLKLMKDHATEAAEKSLKDIKNKTVESHEASKKVKCRFKNTGVCRRMSDCKDGHPRKTCQSHSKLGSCPMESTCEHRHPYGVCYDWEKYGSCNDGDNCRHRHPFDLARPASASEPFLGYSSPGRQGGSGGQGHASHWPAGQGHHDLRGNRW